jgi:pSer/pThr/pTyr-binding forkhead associated (FHA) protein
MSNQLRVRLSLKGRPIRTYTFKKQTVSIGRDPSADIFLDNFGISREHAQIDQTPGGYILADLGSANGTFLNEAQITREFLGQDDVVRIGKFSLWVGVEADRREQLLGSVPLSQETTVLSTEQMEALTRKAQTEEAAVKAREMKERGASAWKLSRASFVIAVLATLLLGILLGVAGMLRFAP